MFARFFNKKPFSIIGLLVFLLLLSAYFETTKKTIPEIADSVNPYFKTLDAEYAEALDDEKLNDSTLFTSTLEKYGKRELLIYRHQPTPYQKNVDFKVEIFPSDKSILTNNKASISLNLTNRAIDRIYNDKLYGVFRLALPFIDIEKLVIHQKKWNVTIEKPFKHINSDFEIINVKDNKEKPVPNPYLGLFHAVLKTKDIYCLPYKYVVSNDSLYQTKIDLEGYRASNNLTIGRILNTNKFWSNINKKDAELSSQIEFTGKEKEAANKLVNNYINGNKSFAQFIDIDKFAIYSAWHDVFSSACEMNLYFVYNKDSDLLEPFFKNSECIGENPRKVEIPKVDNLKFIRTYIEAVTDIADLDLYEELREYKSDFEQELALINSYYPYTVFDWANLVINQNLIRKNLNAVADIEVQLLGYNNNLFTFLISNNSDLPISIKGINYKTKKEITRFSNGLEVLSKQSDTLQIKTPRSFENLFVSKKKKQAGFDLYKDIYDLNLVYTISSTSKEYLEPINPYKQSEQLVEEDIFRIKSTVDEQEGLIINNQKKSIVIDKDITIKTALIVPKGYNFIISPGVVVDIVDGGKIISHAPLQFNGNKTKPIKILSSDKKGQGILVLSDGLPSKLRYVEFDHLSNPVHGNWNITGAVTFYESPVDLKYVTVSNNHCEDALNIVRTTFTMENCTLNKTQSDAFDGDFVTGYILKSKFAQLGNDAIDISGSDLIIKNVDISFAGDKGLSAGEDSKMTVENIKISNSEIGIAGKDLSFVKANKLEIMDTKLAFTAFQKKPEFGPSNIIVSNISLKNIETNYLIENTSLMKVDGKKIKTSKNVKDRMYGVEFGVSSDETRNRQ